MKIIIVCMLTIWGTLYQPAKPKVLIIGDSISIGYFPFVKDALKDKADVYHNAGNAQSTENGVSKIKTWLGDEHWDVIQFNWGLWDLAYRSPALKGTGALDKKNGKLTTTADQYRRNMEELVSILKKTGAKLVFVNTTYVPENEPGRFSADVKKYNRIAEKVAKKNCIIINDLYKPSVKIHKDMGLGDDNVHYSKEGYEELSKVITHKIENVLSLK
jgi:lysophospholipase L1-like esterase